VCEVLFLAEYMDLGRPVLPCFAVTTTNQPSAVVTCQSSTCISSCFGQPVNTSVQANPSIRAIRPNTVRSRAQAYEKKDTDVRKTVTGGNLCSKTAASPLIANVTSDSRHAAVQPSKSLGHLAPSARLKDQSTRFSFDMEKSSECQSPPLPVDRDLLRVSPVGRHSPLETPSDIVMQRLQMFENKPVMLSKPPHLLKPSSPSSDDGVKHLSIYRSKSSDSAKQSEVACQVKEIEESLHLPLGNRLQVHDDTSTCVSSQGAVRQVPYSSLDTSNLCANDVGSVRKRASRQVKEVTVVSPSSSGNKTVVLNPSLQAVTDSRKVLVPKLHQKPQVKENVVMNPYSSSVQVKEPGIPSQLPSPSCTGSNKIVLPKPPQKPQVRKHDTVATSLHVSSSCHEPSQIVSPKPPDKPRRMPVVSHDFVTTAPDDSYGLLVYATGTAKPSIHVEKLSSDVGVTGDPLSAKHTANMHSPKEGRHEGKPEAVPNTSWLQTKNEAHTGAALQPYVSDAWEKKFIRAPKTAVVTSSRGQKENFVSKSRMNNPNYIYISVHADDIITSRSHQKIVADKQPLTRHYSDDMLSMPPAPSLPSPKSPSYKQPLYAVPFDNTEAYSADRIVFDSAGYAMPYVPNTSQFKVI